MIQKKLRIEFSREDGLLIRLAMLLERRSYTIDRYKIFRNNNGGGCMNLTVSGDLMKYDQILNQIRKLVDVIGVCEQNNAAVFIVGKKEVLSL